MRFKDVFSIIGPSMIGPSSSHTAGAVRLGRCARQAFGTPPSFVEIRLYGSFAHTYRGHGTDLALVAGLLDLETDDVRIRRSFELAAQSDLRFAVIPMKRPANHPNTAQLQLYGADRMLMLTGCSIGGGTIRIVAIDRFSVAFAADSLTLLIWHRDRQGMIAAISAVAHAFGVNISRMEVSRIGRHAEALTVMACDGQVDLMMIEQLRHLPDVSAVRLLDLISKEARL